jgi:hypothetical protein
MPLKTTVRMRGIRSPILTLAVITSRFYAATCARKENGRMVANPDGTAFFGDYFRVGGDPTGIVGDEDFSASHVR